MQKLQLDKKLEAALADTLADLLTNIETEFGLYDYQCEDIEHNNVPGFIPHTNGGYMVSLPVSLNYLHSTGKDIGTPKIVKQIDGYIENAYQSAIEHFVDQEPKLKDLFTTEQLENPSNDVINYHDLYKIDEGSLAEALSEIEHDYLTEGSTLFLQYRVQYYAADNFRNETGEDEVCFFSGINLDFEYGRDSGLEVVYEETVKVSDLTPELIKQHVEGMQKDI